MSKELEVIPADVAARLDEHKALIIQWDAGIKQAVDEFETYAFLCGRELLRAKEVVPHGNKDKNGGLMKWVEANFPAMPYKMATRRMAFAETVQAKLDTVSNFKPDLLLTPSRELNTEAVKLIRDAVHEVMDGKSMTAFLRDEGVIRPAKNPNAGEKKKPEPLSPEEQLAAWKERDTAVLQQTIDLMRSLITPDESRPRYFEKEIKKAAQQISIEFTKFLKRGPKETKAKAPGKSAKALAQEQLGKQAWDNYEANRARVEAARRTKAANIKAKGAK